MNSASAELPPQPAIAPVETRFRRARKFSARLTVSGALLILLAGCIISPMIPSWPDGTAGQFVLPAGEDPVVTAQINGQPVRLRVETGYSGIILNSDAAARIGLRPSIFGGEVTVGPIHVEGHSGVAPVAIGPAHDDRRIFWFDRPIAAGVDGIINIADLPFERVTLQLRPDQGDERPIALQTKPQSFWNLTYLHPLGDRELIVRFRLDTPRSLITAAGGALLADLHGGSWDGEPFDHVVALDVRRPVRPLALARPLSLQGLSLDQILVRTADYRGRYALPQDQSADPDEIVISGEARRSTARLIANIGQDSLSRCSRISYERGLRLLTLHCRS